LVKSAAHKLGEYGISVNSVHSWGVATPMILEDTTIEATLSAQPQYGKSFASIIDTVPVAEPFDVSDAVLWLASDMSRAVTATQSTVDMGATKV
jgi:NAD(P)-dependent dehydrogenase (short-subunit alcohol dehydrogenase family)